MQPVKRKITDVKMKNIKCATVGGGNVYSNFFSLTVYSSDFVWCGAKIKGESRALLRVTVRSTSNQQIALVVCNALQLSEIH